MKLHCSKRYLGTWVRTLPFLIADQHNLFTSLLGKFPKISEASFSLFTKHFPYTQIPLPLNNLPSGKRRYGGSKNKSGYFDKLQALLEEYKSVFIVEIDNVSSQQMHEIRQSLRGQGVVLMGKNTMVRRALKTFVPDHPEYERLLPFVRGNVGFVFTNGDLKEVRDKILANRVAAPARAGALAPADVWVPAGNTGMEPGKTSFFQALGVPTKIARGTIEITTDLKLVEAGSKVGPSEATLLNMLNISPFTYGMGIAQVYDDGQAFPLRPRHW
uniref:Large ribosomal subunit protein uL10 n=1 Tax=Bionectria ochroleuca TaxID=29856 RepID=A0A8H7TLY2_BIOOC